MGAVPLRKEPSANKSGKANHSPRFQGLLAHKRKPGTVQQADHRATASLKEGEGRLDVPFTIESLSAPLHKEVVSPSVPLPRPESAAHGRSPNELVVLSADQPLTGYLEVVLRRAGYVTRSAVTTSHLCSISRQLAPSLVLVDCRVNDWPMIRTEPTLRHVLLLTVVPAGCSYPEDRLLEDVACGVDGFHRVEDGPRLLTATVGACLRRLKGRIPPRGIHRIGAIELDGDQHEVRIAGQPVRLSAKPFAILKALMQSYPAVCRRDELLARIWGPGFAIGARVLDAHVHVIRRLLAQHPGSRCHIATVRKIGFKLEVGKERREFFSRSASEPIQLTGDDPGCVPRHPVETSTVAAARSFMSVTKMLLRPGDKDQRSGGLAKRFVTIYSIEGGKSCVTLFVGSSSRS